MALGLSMIGTIHENKILTKTGSGLGQSLILAKPQGTGIILAAEMRGKAKVPWMQAVIYPFSLIHDWDMGDDRLLTLCWCRIERPTRFSSVAAPLLARTSPGTTFWVT